MTCILNLIEIYYFNTALGKNWLESDILSSRIPLYLAEMNKEAGFLRMQALTAVFRLPPKTKNIEYNQKLVEEEKLNAINLTIEANKIFPGTVWGLSIQLNLFLTEEQFDLKNETEIVKGMLRDVRSNFRAAGYPDLQVGLRVVGCENLLKDESKGNRSEQK